MASPLLNNPLLPIRKNKHNLPLPSVCHQEIPDYVVGDRAVFVIGDIHGCLEEMCELMDKANNLYTDTIFIFVGDLVTKGPRSVDTLRKVREMVLNGKAYAVRGNQDENALNQVKMNKEPDYKLPKKHKWIEGLEEDDIAFLNSLPYTISIPCLKAIIVHAGIVPGKPLEEQKLYDLTNMRNILDTGEGLTGYKEKDTGVAWVNLWRGPEHVYFGHDAGRKFQQAEYATGLDTGCCYGRKLTGVFINKGHPPLFVESQQ